MKRLLLSFAVIMAALSASAENYILYTSSDGQVVEPNDYKVFGANIVSNTYEDGLGKILFDSEVTAIGYCAFRFCSALTSVIIPNSVTTIGEAAFDGCNSLTSIDIPESVTEIGDFAFRCCSSLPVENSIRYAGSYLIEVVDNTILSRTGQDGLEHMRSAHAQL